MLLGSGHYACSPNPTQISIDILLPVAKKVWPKIMTFNLFLLLVDG